jgi:hypothetical protein
MVGRKDGEAHHVALHIAVPKVQADLSVFRCDRDGETGVQQPALNSLVTLAKPPWVICGVAVDCVEAWPRGKRRTNAAAPSTAAEQLRAFGLSANDAAARVAWVEGQVLGNLPTCAPVLPARVNACQTPVRQSNNSLYMIFIFKFVGVFRSSAKQPHSAPCAAVPMAPTAGQPGAKV